MIPWLLTAAWILLGIFEAGVWCQDNCDRGEIVSVLFFTVCFGPAILGALLIMGICYLLWRYGLLLVFRAGQYTSEYLNSKG